MLHRKLTRRRLLGSSLATAAGLTLLSCGGDEEEGAGPTPGITPGTTPSGEPVRGGTIRLSSAAPILSLEPHETAGVSVATYFYSYVVHVTDWQGNVGDLAESWETPSDTEWIFHLRGDAVFQDIPPANGRPVVAEDIVKSIDRYRSMPGASTSWDEWTERYEAPDPRTFKEVTKKPYGYFLMDLGSPLTAILPLEAVEQFGDLKSHAIGSGPYMLKSHSRDQGMEVVRNPTYYREYPYVDGISIKVLPDEASIQAAFRAGSIDVYTASNKLKADAVKDVGGATIQKFLDRTYSVLVLNGVKLEAFKDVRVREAVDLALDRQAMIDRLHFGDAELAGPVPPLWDASLPKEEIEAAYKRDVAKAKQLLSAAGAEGLTFSLSFANYQDNPDRAAIIKANLAEAGIDVQLQAGELGTWINDLTVGNFQATTFSHLRYLSDYIQIQSHHSHGWAHTPEGYLGVDDDEVDAMLEQINGTIDDEERIKLEQDAQRKILARHGPTLVLYEPYGYWAAYDFIKGYTPTSYGFGLYKYDYWIDKG
ncbi:MAG: ABC transporter substrate-binding protein [Dehalococcoidia bacterium]|nr:ABC transporter substrate-binding protein [Dehalococcoidia bacterium]